jgi:hypothetical protein
MTTNEPEFLEALPPAKTRTKAKAEVVPDELATAAEAATVDAPKDEKPKVEPAEDADPKDDPKDEDPKDGGSGDVDAIPGPDPVVIVPGPKPVREWKPGTNKKLLRLRKYEE